MRAMFLLLSALGFGFALISLRVANSQRAFEIVYRRIVTGETLPNAFIERMARRGDEEGSCDGDAKLAVALIELKLVEASLAQGRDVPVEEHLRRARSNVIGQIACSPTNGFAWFVLFWSEVVSGTLTNSAWAHLGASYRFAPREAWVALSRLPHVANLWSLIPTDQRRLVLDDFEMLLNEGYISQCARLYAFASPDLMSGMAGRLMKAPEARKLQFNAALASYDVDPVSTETGGRQTELLRQNLRDLSEALTK